jgi:hypothetical protein
MDVGCHRQMLWGEHGRMRKHLPCFPPFPRNGWCDNGKAISIQNALVRVGVARHFM